MHNYRSENCSSLLTGLVLTLKGCIDFTILSPCPIISSGVLVKVKKTEKFNELPCLIKDLVNPRKILCFS